MILAKERHGPFRLVNSRETRPPTGSRSKSFRCPALTACKSGIKRYTPPTWEENGRTRKCHLYSGCSGPFFQLLYLWHLLSTHRQTSCFPVIAVSSDAVDRGRFSQTNRMSVAMVHAWTFRGKSNYCFIAFTCRIIIILLVYM